MRISDWSSDVCSSRSLEQRRYLFDRFSRRRYLDTRVARGENRQHFEPEEPERGGGGAHPHTAAVGGPGTARESFERCGLFEQFCAAFDELLAFAGPANAARSALENLAAELVFVNMDASRPPRLGAVECRRSLSHSPPSPHLKVS